VCDQFPALCSIWSDSPGSSPDWRHHRAEARWRRSRPPLSPELAALQNFLPSRWTGAIGESSSAAGCVATAVLSKTASSANSQSPPGWYAAAAEFANTVAVLVCAIPTISYSSVWSSLYQSYSTFIFYFPLSLSILSAMLTRRDVFKAGWRLRVWLDRRAPDVRRGAATETKASRRPARGATVTLHSAIPSSIVLSGRTHTPETARRRAKAALSALRRARRHRATQRLRHRQPCTIDGIRARRSARGVAVIDDKTVLMLNRCDGQGGHWAFV
jgi:hypothetical protein